ncbi:MAG: hypothetical protein ACI4VF_10230 [Lachnospirales bacterium]
MELDAVTLISKDMEKQNFFMEEIFNNIYKNLSTNCCEYVDNYNNMYKTFENITKTYENSYFQGVNNFTDIFHNHYKNIINMSNFSDKSKGFSGYVENFVDKSAKLDNFFPLIHRVTNISNNKNLENAEYSKAYSNLNEFIRNVDNSTSYQQSKKNFNINLGGITQNFASSDSNDVVDILVEKLKMAVSGFGDGVY